MGERKEIGGRKEGETEENEREEDAKSRYPENWHGLPFDAGLCMLV